MKRTFAASLFAGLLVTVFAYAHAETYGPPAATLKVGQIPRFDDDVMTPLPPDDSALPTEAAKMPDVPPVAGAMPVEHVEVHDLTPGDKTAAPVVADAMPPNPSPIKNARAPASVKTAEMGPVQNTLTPAQPHGPSSLPFPPSAQDWAARMPLGGTMKVASAAPAASDTAPKMIHVDNRAAEMVPMDSPPSLTIPAPEIAMTGPPAPAPGPAIVHHSAPQVYASADPVPPAHIVVQPSFQPQSSSECRSYTRTLEGSHGRQAAGTACLGEDGVWRIASEHLLPQPHHQSVRVVSAPPPVYYYPAPVQVYEPSYVIAGYYGYGHGYGHRWRGWR